MAENGSAGASAVPAKAANSVSGYRADGASVIYFPYAAVISVADVQVTPRVESHAERTIKQGSSGRDSVRVITASSHRACHSRNDRCWSDFPHHAGDLVRDIDVIRGVYDHGRKCCKVRVCRKRSDVLGALVHSSNYIVTIGDEDIADAVCSHAKWTKQSGRFS